MKFSKKDIGLLLGCFGVLLAVMSYSLVFTPFTDKASALKSELASLQQLEAKYVDMEQNQDYYQQEIVRLTEENQEIIDEFPAGIEPENEIMYVVELEKNVKIDIPSISYGTATPVLGSGELVEEAEEGDILSEGIQAYVIPMNVSYTSSYKGLKEAITYTKNHSNRMYIDTVSVSYDSSSGDVSGSMTFNLYYMTGTDKVYQGLTLPDISTGVDNIFGSK